jgi:aquaporin Z
MGAELIGTFALVLVAAGADTAARVSGGQVSEAARAVAPALLVASFIYAMGDVSGAHFNTVVSMAFAAKRLFPMSWVLVYWAAQVVGAILAAFALRALFGAAAEAGVSRPHIPDLTAVVVEAGLTWILLMVILGTSDRHRVVGTEAAIAVGSTIALCGLVAIPLTGASMNPARSIGPAIASGAVGDVWIYIVGPILGALAAVVITRLLHGPVEGEPGALEAAQGSGPR